MEDISHEIAQRKNELLEQLAARAWGVATPEEGEWTLLSYRADPLFFALVPTAELDADDLQEKVDNGVFPSGRIALKRGEGGIQASVSD